MVGGRYRDLSNRQAVVIPGNRLHTFMTKTDSQIIELKFALRNQRLSQLLEDVHLLTLDAPQDVEDTLHALVNEGLRREFLYEAMTATLLHRLLLLHVRLLSRAQESGSFPAPETKADDPVRLFQKGFNTETAAGAKVAKIIGYMDENMERPITLDGLARHFGYTPSYLCQMFSATVGISPIRYLTLLRLSRAQTLLVSSSFSLRHISSVCGFRSPHHMWRVFKAELGCSPTQFRQRHSNAQAAAINFTGLRESQWNQIL